MKRKLVGMLSGAAAVLLLSACASDVGTVNIPTAPTARYIVQGSSADAAESAVEAVGARISHKLPVIRSVGTTLTIRQKAELEELGMRLFLDQALEISSVCSLTSGSVRLESKKLHWTVHNNSASTLTVGAVSVAWPSEDGVLKKIRLDGDDIYTQPLSPPYSQVVSGWHDDARRREIAPGTSEELSLEFDADIDTYQGNYTIFVDFQEGCSLEFVPDSTACRVDGLGYRKLDAKRFEWDLVNTGNSDIHLQSVSVNWPESNQRLTKIKLDGDTPFDGLRDMPVTTVSSGWHSDPNKRLIKAGADRRFKLEFETDIDVDQEAYSVMVEFYEGCKVEFVPDLAGTYSGEKPDKKARITHSANLVSANQLHEEGITGEGVTVAILDTGMWSSGGGKNWLRKDRDGNERVLLAYDATADTEGDVTKAEDKNGHGTHIASVISSTRRARSGNGAVQANGIAPDADLLVVKAFDEDGRGSYLDVIRGIDWIVAHKDTYGVRVLNMSFSAPPRSHYWDDPLNQAVMAAWQAGIVVVASAGNTGPDPMTIGVPGNVPYVITVGAMTDNRTPEDASDDYLATFSSAGPTHEGFLKPELLAPGGRVLGMMNKKSRIPKDHPDFHDGDAYYYMSGTSQAAAVMSGVAALLLDAEPSLTPDQVKCKLMSAARPAANSDGELAYSVFQQGAGLVNAYDAVYATEYDCANIGMDIGLDLAGAQHYGGPANRDADGNYYIMDVDGYLWGRTGVNGYLWSGQYTLSNGYLWGRTGVDGYLWSRPGVDGYLWSGNSFVNGYLWHGVGVDGYLWSGGLNEIASINVWVEQE